MQNTAPSMVHSLMNTSAGADYIRKGSHQTAVFTRVHYMFIAMIRGKWFSRHAFATGKKKKPTLASPSVPAFLFSY